MGTYGWMTHFLQECFQIRDNNACIESPHGIYQTGMDLPYFYYQDGMGLNSKNQLSCFYELDIATGKLKTKNWGNVWPGELSRCIIKSLENVLCRHVLSQCWLEFWTPSYNAHYTGEGRCQLAPTILVLWWYYWCWHQTSELKAWDPLGTPSPPLFFSISTSTESSVGFSDSGTVQPN